MPYRARDRMIKDVRAREPLPWGRVLARSNIALRTSPGERAHRPAILSE